MDRAAEAGIDFVHFNGMSGEYYFSGDGDLFMTHVSAETNTSYVW